MNRHRRSELLDLLVCARLGGSFAALVVDRLRDRFGSARPELARVATAYDVHPRTVRRLYAALDLTREERVRALSAPLPAEA